MKMNVKKISFEGWSNCVELKNGNFRLIVTTDVGPRIIGAFLDNSPNMMFVDPKTRGKSNGKSWNRNSYTN